jgi:transcription antitermination factor NusG
MRAGTPSRRLRLDIRERRPEERCSCAIGRLCNCRRNASLRSPHGLSVRLAALYVPRARVFLKSVRKPVIRVLYVGYALVDLDANPLWRMIQRQPGVISFVLTGDMPSRCPESETLKLKASEIDGVVQMVGPPPSDKRFKEGQLVRIRGGGFDGREARYVRPARQNMSRVVVTLLSRTFEVAIATCSTR